MTAQLLEYTTPSDALVRRVQAARSAKVGAPVAPHRPAVIRAEERWSARQAVACAASRPAVSAAPRVGVASRRLEWTPRGVAVMVLLVALVAGVMLSTMVGAFLSVSNEALVAPAAPAVVAAVPAAPGS